MVSCKFIVLAVIVTLASAQQGGQNHYGHHDHHAPAHYQFAYSVHDPHTHDVKEQHEARQGDHVQGHYSLVEPDGTTRIVHYTADKHNGFQARVEHKGHAVHPQVQHHHHHQVPVHHVAPSYHHSAPSHHGATSHISFNRHGGHGNLY